ncbi:ATP-dependent DNA helicase RecG, partial [Solemya velum gill symbiont]
MQALDKQPVTTLKGIGPRSAERLASIGIETVEDVLFHLPFRYQDRTRVTPIGSGRHGDHLVIDARVDNAHVHYGRRRSLLVQVSDGSGRLLLRFFHFSNSQKNGFSKGARISCFGEVRRGPNTLELIHPEYRLLSEDHAFEVEESLTPIYPTTEGMQQQSWRDLTDKALALMEAGGALRELLPDSLLPTTTAISLANAIRTLHRPPPDTAVRQIEAGEHPAQQRLVFEELIGHQLSLLKLRRQQKSQNAFSISHTGKLAATLYQQIPFRLTAAQQRVLQEIESDLQQKHPMQRLIQGDVGSGKTIVAAFAALQAIEAGYQVAVMAPTELLAEQ